MSLLWDHCHLNAANSEALKQIDSFIEYNGYYGTTSSEGQADIICRSHKHNSSAPLADPSAGGNSILVDFDHDKNGVDGLQASLLVAEVSCRNFVLELDSILVTLEEIATLHDDVTGRTNSLMLNCENLLEQQHTLQATVESLKHTLTPFDEIESIASMLGIPFDPKGVTKIAKDGTDEKGSSRSNGSAISLAQSSSLYSSNATISTTIDPRSAEFREVLARLSKALNFLQTHREFRDSDKYQRWLEQLQNRAVSLVARAMRELLESAAKSCSQQSQVRSNIAGGANSSKDRFTTTTTTTDSQRITGGSFKDFDDSPLESAPIYQKFRGLGFRMRELSALLGECGHDEQGNAPAPLSVQNSDPRLQHTKVVPALDQLDHEIIAEVKQAYVLIRTELLLPFVRDVCSSALASHGYRKAASLHPSQSPRAQLGEAQHSGASGTATSSILTSTSAAMALCLGIRHAYSSILRISQLEQQLFDSLFTAAPSAATDDSSNYQKNSDHDSRKGVNGGGYTMKASQSSEVQSIVESVSNAAGDFLRPLVIHESDVDELCRLINTLAEDVRSQMLALLLPRPLLKQLQKGLDRTVSDAQERLAYCAETKLRLEVELFEPLPSHLAYPDVLEKHRDAVREATKEAKMNKLKNITSTNPGIPANRDAVDDVDIPRAPQEGESTGNGMVPSAPSSVQGELEDVSSTWYPPLRFTLSLLSKLYGVVDMAVFEHFASRSVALCVRALRSGADGVKKTRSILNGDLFLVRHLLVLREQLIPFEIRLQSVQKELDFAPSQRAISHLFRPANARSLLRFDTANPLLQLARDGLPAMHEKELDAKRELDGVLKAACLDLKQSALKLLMGPADSFLAKVEAFVGEIPTRAGGGSSGPTYGTQEDSQGRTHVLATSKPLLSAEARNSLKTQAFVRHERIKEMLLTLQEAAVQSAPDLKDVLQLYVENSVARTILLRPIQQEVEAVHRKLDCVIDSCIDPGQTKRDLEQLLQSVVSTISSELQQ